MNELNKYHNLPYLLEMLGRSAFGSNWKASLADRIPVARSTISDWLSGKKPIPLHTWSTIQKILKNRLNELNDGVDVISKKHLIIIGELKRKGIPTIKDDAFSSFLNDLNDDKIIFVKKIVENEFLKTVKNNPNQVFPDLALIIDALNYQILIRDINGSLDVSSIHEVVESYNKNLTLVKHFDLDDIYMSQRLKTIISNQPS